jgi:hypothetical protein
VANQLRSGGETVATSVPAFEAIDPRRLSNKHVNGVPDVKPRGDAPKQGDAQTYVEVPAAASVVTLSLGRLVHEASILAVVAAVQLAWLSILGYGIVSLLR